MGWMRLEIGHVLPNYPAPLNFLFSSTKYAEFLNFLLLCVRRVTYDSHDVFGRRRDCVRGRTPYPRSHSFPFVP